MPKRTSSTKKSGLSRNWLAYLCEALVTSGVMPTWEAATYLTENLFGELPNPRLLGTTNAHEITTEFLRRLYQPLVEAASREATIPHGGTVHLFTDISLTGKSAVLIVLLGNELSHQLLMFEAVKAWDLVFQDAESFNQWAEDRYRQIKSSLVAAVGKPARQPLLAAVS